jgi:hypothetical protein
MIGVRVFSQLSCCTVVVCSRISLRRLNGGVRTDPEESN